MPSLPKPRSVAAARARAALTPRRLSATSRASRSSRRPACAGSTSSARARSTRPGSRSASSSTRSTTRTSSRATSARRSTSTTTTCSSSCTSRATTRRSARLNAAEVDIFVGPDFLITLPNEPLQPIEYLFERCRTNEELRETLFSKGAGYLLYKIVDDCVDASFPMLRKMGNKLERIEEDIFEGELGRGRARHLQRQAGDHQLPQDRPPAARGVPRPRAHQDALHRRRPRHLLRRHQRRLRARSGTCSRTTRRSSRRSRTPTSRRSRTAPTRSSAS